MSTASPEGRISPSDVRNASFEVVGRGYDQQAVHEFLRAIAEQLEADQHQPHAASPAAKDEMVKVITQAQILAEKFVSEAEQYSKDLVASARTQYGEILRRAEESVSTRQAVPVQAATAAGYTDPIQEIEYVRTYTKVAQVQLRAVIDALAEQVDRLGDLPVARTDRRDGNG
ncbi:cell division initiation protein [Arthrobacter ginsengisoli]|uniref:Cell wall synthesis protein Wag31 n=1 Tax=Arthrobacter ginsengisoli TaxID=1356565 RepID=A0ABU1UDM5_9MICC|nr:DivIVA domain-containing protein [Arthrobacter ginsengisoli]MDR7083235.1 cell division initiation protein [Arthrobacter ginsengisoli]